MVDISRQLSAACELVAAGKYFCINRARQYGKTTTLRALANQLKDRYLVFNVSFEGLGNEAFATDSSLVRAFVQSLKNAIDFGVVANVPESIRQLVDAYLNQAERGEQTLQDCGVLITKLCQAADKPMVLIIDEVDQAGNYESFIHFLGLLRSKYLSREDVPTIHSVVLAGVYDIKNLKLKVRTEGEHQYNSPWNIAAPFEVDMSLSEAGIRGMLEEYENDHHVGMDTAEVAKLLREYTGGYPFLVSRLCQLMDASGDWSRQGFLAAEKQLVGEADTLFDDFQKKLHEFPRLKDMLREVLYYGKSIDFSRFDPEMQLAARFGFVKDELGSLTVANRIFETWLYNYFVSETMLHDQLFSRAKESKPMFITEDGGLDMPKIMQRFVDTFHEVYGDRGDRFLEDEGRRYFMLYVKPIINGVGNYYVEAQTRDGLRTDLIIDYRGHRYVVEMKIWRGENYNTRGEAQLCEYLDYFQVNTGYLLSFSFNKNKTTGLKPPMHFGARTIIEAVV